MNPVRPQLIVFLFWREMPWGETVTWDREEVSCFALLCSALHCFDLHCFALHCFALLCIVLLCIALRCFALHCLMSIEIATIPEMQAKIANYLCWELPSRHSRPYCTVQNRSTAQTKLNGENACHFLNMHNAIQTHTHTFAHPVLHTGSFRKAAGRLPLGTHVLPRVRWDFNQKKTKIQRKAHKGAEVDIHTHTQHQRIDSRYGLKKC